VRPAARGPVHSSGPLRVSAARLKKESLEVFHEFRRGRKDPPGQDRAVFLWMVHDNERRRSVTASAKRYNLGSRYLREKQFKENNLKRGKNGPMRQGDASEYRRVPRTAASGATSNAYAAHWAGFSTPADSHGSLPRLNALAASVSAPGYRPCGWGASVGIRCG
jgi:hypothetical protein